MKIRLFAPFASSKQLLAWVERQTPSLQNSRYKNLQFVIDDSYTHAVALNRCTPEIKSPSANNICFRMEPAVLMPMQLAFANKCDRYFTFSKADREVLGSKYRPLHMQNILHTPIISQLPLPSEKVKKASIVVSLKARTPFHKKRKAVALALLEQDLGIDAYGRDFNEHQRVCELPPLNKSQALTPYRFTIGFENSPEEGYITEKFHDGIVNQCIVITNNRSAESLFPAGSYVYIDFDQSVEVIVNQIANTLASNVTSKHDRAVVAAKDSILFGSNSFVENIWKALHGVI